MTTSLLQILLLYILLYLAVKTQKYLSPRIGRSSKIFYVGAFCCYSVFLLLYFAFSYEKEIFSDGVLLVAALAIMPDAVRASVFKFGRTYAGIARDAVFNLLLFVGCYLIVIYNKIEAVSLILLIALLIFRICLTIFYRINFAPSVYLQEIGNTAGAKLNKYLLPIQPLADYGTRTLVHFYLANTLICIAIFFSGRGPDASFDSSGAFVGKSSGQIIVDALYFVVVTIHTVGYGDMSPVTIGSRLFVSFIIFASSIVVAFILTDLFNFTVALYNRKLD